MGSSPVILDAVVIPLIRGPKILDVGCGFGRWGSLINTNYWETCSGNKSEKPAVIGCEGYRPNVELARGNGFYDKIVKLRFPPLAFETSSFNTVLVLDVIEHLKKEEGLKLVEDAKRIASDRVILSTPNRQALRDAHITMTGWNGLEAHVSYWPRSYLRGLGFRLYGAGWRPGGIYWRGLLRKITLLPFYDRVARPCLSSMSLYAPFFSENVVGVWEKGNSI
jgi:SAM-dependent methyltransferase